MKRTSRKIWSGRVRRWKASGLTAKQFAGRLRFSVGALHYWSWRLRREERARGAASTPMIPPVVEIVGAAGVVGHDLRPGEPFEVLIGDRVRIRVPVHFDEAALVRLVDALERR